MKKRGYFSYTCSKLTELNEKEKSKNPWKDDLIPDKGRT